MAMLFLPKEDMKNIRIHKGSVYLVGEVVELSDLERKVLIFYECNRSFEKESKRLLWSC